MGAKKGSGKLTALFLLIALISASLTIAFAETEANTNSQAIDINSNEIERNTLIAQDLNIDSNTGPTITYSTQTIQSPIQGQDQNISTEWWGECSYASPAKHCLYSSPVSSDNTFQWAFYDCMNAQKITEGTKCYRPGDTVCTDWAQCPSGHKCQFWSNTTVTPSCTPCTDECSQGATRCINSWYRESCGNYDSDSCYEWGNQTYCQYGCSSGQCNNTQPCTDECSYSGQTRCNGSNKEVCGNYDSDNCLEWQSTNCPDGCENGNCRTCTSHFTARCVSGDLYWFDSCNRQQEMKEDCRVSCNETNAYCENGCKANWKIYALDLWRNGKPNTTIQYDLRDSTGWQFAGQTNSSGLLEFTKIILYSCHRAVNIKAISAEGALCGENWSLVEKENDTDTLFFNCPWALTLNGLIASINTDKSTYTQEESVSISIRVADWWGNPVQGASIGLILPDNSKATAPNTNSQGNSTYTIKADGTGNQKITAIASKVGYWVGYGETRFTVKEKPKTVIKVTDSQGKTLEGAQVLVDGTFAGNTNAQGMLTLQLSAGTHAIEAKNQYGKSCGTKQATQNDSRIEFFCSAIGNLVVRVKTKDTGYPIANAYIFLDGKEMGLTNPTGALFMRDIPNGTHEVTVGLKIKIRETDSDYSALMGSKTIKFNEQYKLYDFELTPEAINPLSAEQDKQDNIITLSTNVKPQLLDKILIIGAIIGTIVGIFQGYDWGQKCDGPYITSGAWSEECSWQGLWVVVDVILSGSPKFIGKIFGITYDTAGKPIMAAVGKIPGGSKFIKYGDDLIEWIGENGEKVYTKFINGEWKVINIVDELAAKFGDDAARFAKKINIRFGERLQYKELQGIAKIVIEYPEGKTGQARAVMEIMTDPDYMIWGERTTKEVLQVDDAGQFINLYLEGHGPMTKIGTKEVDVMARAYSKNFYIESTGIEDVLVKDKKLYDVILDKSQKFVDASILSPRSDTMIIVELPKGTTFNKTEIERTIWQIYQDYQSNMGKVSRVGIYNTSTEKVITVYDKYDWIHGKGKP